MTRDIPSKLIATLQAAKHIVVFTGAGVSKESGIPTFRDAMTGLWEIFDPNALGTPAAFNRQRDVVWGWYEYRRAHVLRCQPNPAHIAIATMSAYVQKLTVITQNVDDLHERAGSNDVIHLHGSLHHPRCLSCYRPHPLPPQIPEIPEEGRHQMPPKCEHCGGWIRPGVVWFGEELDRDILGRARRAVHSCDVLFSIGTSSMVYPAASLPFEAREQGACVIQVNPHPTDLDDAANYNFHDLAGTVLPALLDTAWPKGR